MKRSLSHVIVHGLKNLGPEFLRNTSRYVLSEEAEARKKQHVKTLMLQGTVRGELKGEYFTCRSNAGRREADNNELTPAGTNTKSSNEEASSFLFHRPSFCIR